MSIENRLTELESRLAFQDDTVHSLNEIVAQQQKAIDQLSTQLRDVVSLLRSLRSEVSEGGAMATEHERPPHY